MTSPSAPLRLLGCLAAALLLAASCSSKDDDDSASAGDNGDGVGL